MSERLTVVFDDGSLYRRLKVAAAEAHVPLKRMVEDAIRAYLGPEAPAERPFDWDAYDRWQEEVADLNTEAERSERDERILTLPLRHEGDARPLQSMAEEQTPYEPGPVE